MLIKKLVILLALIQPIIIYLFSGEHSFSQCWNTPLEPLYILVNASTSYFLFNLKRWKVSSLFLMLLTVFSTEQYSDLHNIFATVFFISCLYGFSEYNKLRNYFIPLYVFGCFTAFYGLFWLETYFSYLIAIYHLIILFRVEKTVNNNNKVFNCKI